jgi:hypothetical protein
LKHESLNDVCSFNDIGKVIRLSEKTDLDL